MKIKRHSPKGKVSVSQRLRETLDTAHAYAGEATALRVINDDLKAQVQASRFAAMWYRRRWFISTTIAILFGVLYAAALA